MRLRAVALVVAVASALTMGLPQVVNAASPGAATKNPPTLNISNGIVKPGATILVTGENWPATSQAVITTCGNLSLNLSVDCDLSSQTSAVVGSDGKFTAQATVGKPKTPCPCVIRVASSSTSVALTAAINLKGQPTQTPTLNQQTRSAYVTVKLSGGGSIKSWFGGAATRDATITVTNTGNVPLALSSIRVTAGKGKSPTDVVALPAQTGDVPPGQIATIRTKVTLGPPAFGRYTVKATVVDVVPQPVGLATTNSYPWLLLICLWLLLQPILLGLYKRRPVVDEPEDPLAAPQGGLGGPVPVPAMAAAEDPYLAGMAAAGVVAGAAYSDPHYGALVAGATTAVVPRAPSALVPNYRPVFGVTDLRHYLDPAGAAYAPTIAPRIVLGGLVPLAEPTYPAPGDPGLNGTNGTNGAAPTHDANGYPLAPPAQQ